MRTSRQALGWILAATALEARAATLEIEVAGAAPSGAVRVAVFSSREPFERKQALREEVLPAGQDVARIEGLAPGEYAVRVFQDLNGNGQLDRRGFLPAEPFGFSRNYRPRFGPPSFADLLFSVSGEGARQIIQLVPPPRRGAWAVGAALIVRTESYRGAGDRIIPIPFVSYVGPRLQWFGPFASYTLYETGDFSLAGVARYTFDGYEQNDSAAFEGMPDRDATVEAGFRAGWSFAPRWRVDAGFVHDLLDRHEGFRASLGLRRTFTAGKLTATPELGLEWMDDAVAGYYYGVEPEYARPDRSAYAPDDAWEPRLGIALLYPVLEKWTVSLRFAARLLPGELTASPLVADGEEITAFMSVSRAL